MCFIKNENHLKSIKSIDQEPFNVLNYFKLKANDHPKIMKELLTIMEFVYC